MESYVRITCDNDQYGIKIGDVCELEPVETYGNDYRVYKKGKYLYTTPIEYVHSMWKKLDSEDDKFRELLLDA